MLQHQVERFSAGLFAKIGQQCYVAAKNGLQARSNGSDNRPRANNNAAHHAESTHYAKSVQFKLRGHHGVRHHGSASWIGYGHETTSCLMRFALIYTK